MLSQNIASQIVDDINHSDGLAVLADETADIAGVINFLFSNLNQIYLHLYYYALKWLENDFFHLLLFAIPQFYNLIIFVFKSGQPNTPLMLYLAQIRKIRAS